jgi:hypothetical protein
VRLGFRGLSGERGAGGFQALAVWRLLLITLGSGFFFLSLALLLLDGLLTCGTRYIFIRVEVIVSNSDLYCQKKYV